VNIDSIINQLIDKNQEDSGNTIEIPIELLHYMIQDIQKLKEENFELNLEKSIFAHIPTDFEDVRAVVVDRLGDEYSSEKIDKVVKEVKKEFPNLFVNINNLIPKNIELK
jgi:ATP-dependent phosphoenolpyruvate carboxykinase